MNTWRWSLGLGTTLYCFVTALLLLAWGNALGRPAPTPADPRRAA